MKNLKNANVFDVIGTFFLIAYSTLLVVCCIVSLLKFIHNV